MGAVVQNVAVAVVGGSKTGQRGHLVGRRRIRWLERVSRAAREHVLGDVSKWVVRKALSPAAGAAVDLRNPRQVVVLVVAGLRISAVERVRDGVLPQRAVGVPGQISDEGLRRIS